MSHYIYRLFINFLLIHYFIYRLVRCRVGAPLTVVHQCVCNFYLNLPIILDFFCRSASHCKFSAIRALLCIFICGKCVSAGIPGENIFCPIFQSYPPLSYPIFCQDIDYLVSKSAPSRLISNASF